ncbi:hypothetical protein G6F22_015909 [Rhizopus arrhizus]|nr:hypothetical protein G6F22_015909 [Rhizopus arrhizus]
MLPLIERSVAEHDALKDDAQISHLFRRNGWIDGVRTEAGLARAIAEADALTPYGLNYRVLDRQALAALEPSLSARMVGAVHWLDPVNVSDPGAPEASRGQRLAGAGRGWSDRSARRGRGVGAVVARCPASIGLSHSNGGQAGLSPALRAGGRRDLIAPGVGHRLRIRRDADDVGRAADDGGGVRGARRAAVSHPG